MNKIFNKCFAVALLAANGFAALPAIADNLYTPQTRARRIDDSSGTFSLSGDVIIGQANLPPVPTPDTSAGKSWTSYFLGQRRCTDPGVCATIHSDGAVMMDNGVQNLRYFLTPIGNTTIAAGTWGFNGGSASILIGPVLSNSEIRDGSKPKDWYIGLSNWVATPPNEN